ncbi:hypothetical protein E5206_02065 [Arthrobacter sp. PAMC25564]|uniref:hypothetical protein n=1 Tax=Arthrobacter sp. PAMC25564 TaxID=2565366 RepID=UPI0010A22438|nr:hypothetical protein [Arthrobacter sp. PAMC25564]QCB95863.1 hypothetical protein E5206_02065 [Arthrobacter sp. PAMC25564]
MRKSAAAVALTGISLTGALLMSGCRAGTVCPAIGQAPLVALTVAKDYAASVRTVHLRACQAGRCAEADLQLVPGYTTVDQGCGPGPEDGERPCSASSSPDGTLRGMLMFDGLTGDSIEATSTGTDPGGLPLPVRTLTFTPRVAYPFGEKCGRFITAGLVLDAGGLRQGPEAPAPVRPAPG